MRGYFGIGVEGISKQMNLGNLFRSAHGFGASFVYTVNAAYSLSGARSDTARTPEQVPMYNFADVASMTLPRGCKLIGVEILDEATELPSFRHPRCAAYVLGAERFGLSQAMLERCDHVVRIPTGFSINVATAGAILMYDRVISTRRFPGRPIVPGGAPEPLPDHVWGEPRQRSARGKDRVS